MRATLDIGADAGKGVADPADEGRSLLVATNT